MKKECEYEIEELREREREVRLWWINGGSYWRGKEEILGNAGARNTNTCSFRFAPKFIFMQPILLHNY